MKGNGQSPYSFWRLKPHKDKNQITISILKNKQLTPLSKNSNTWIPAWLHHCKIQKIFKSIKAFTDQQRENYIQNIEVFMHHHKIRLNSPLVRKETQANWWILQVWWTVRMMLTSLYTFLEVREWQQREEENITLNSQAPPLASKH